MDSGDLDGRSRRLGDVQKKLKRLDEPVVGVRLDILEGVARDLNSNAKLQEIFGSPVSSKLGVVASVNDLIISELQMVNLTDGQRKVFKEELEKIVLANIRKASI